MPAYAECGGLMYLARSLSWRGEHAPHGRRDSRRRRDARAAGGPRLREARADRRASVAGAAARAHRVPAHEFHYSSIEGLAADTRFAYRVARGHGTDGKSDGIVVNNLLANYAHLRSAGSCDWAARFVGFVRRRRPGAAPRRRA